LLQKKLNQRSTEKRDEGTGGGRRRGEGGALPAYSDRQEKVLHNGADRLIKTEVAHSSKTWAEINWNADRPFTNDPDRSLPAIAPVSSQLRNGAPSQSILT